MILNHLNTRFMENGALFKVFIFACKISSK